MISDLIIKNFSYMLEGSLSPTEIYSCVHCSHIILRIHGDHNNIPEQALSKRLMECKEYRLK